MPETAERLTRHEAHERADAQERRAANLWSEAASLEARANRHERWARRWRKWADGTGPYPTIPYTGTDEV